MAIPVFGEGGELPPGVHRASLRETMDRFGITTAQRMLVALRLERLYGIARSTRELARFVVFGSFVTDKGEPNDVDVFFIMEDTFDASKLSGEAALLFDHLTAQAHFGASVFWVRRMGALGGEQTMVESWQVKRGGGRRGIVEIGGEEP